MIDDKTFTLIRNFLKCEDYRDKCPNGTKLDAVILHITTEMHDSGYPFIEAFGWEQNTKTLYNLGWHDHFLVKRQPINIDSFGQNLIHIYPWKETESWTAEPYYYSTLELTEEGVVN